MEKKNVVVSLIIRNAQGLWIHHSSNEFNSQTLYEGTVPHEAEIPAYALAPGSYFVDFVLGERNVELFENVTGGLKFKVEFIGEMSDRTFGTDWKGVCGPGIVRWR